MAQRFRSYFPSIGPQTGSVIGLGVVWVLAQGACGGQGEASGPRGSTSDVGSMSAMAGVGRPGPRRRTARPVRPVVRRPALARPHALFRGSAGRLGRYRGPGPRARELGGRYAVRLAQQVLTSAVSDGRRVFLVSARGLVVAARVSDGGILWSHSTRGGVLVAPGLGDGRLFVGDRTGRVWCFDAKTGAVRWKRKVPGAVRSSPLPQPGRVVVGTHGGRLLALDASTGAVRWELKQRRPFVGVAGSPDGSLVVAASFDRRVRLMEGATGRVRWTAQMKNSSRVDPVLTHDAVYVLSASGVMSRLDRASGRLVWSRPELGYKSPPPAVGKGRIYLASRKRLLYALDAKTGKSRWVKPLSYIPSAPPVFARDTIFLATRGPRLLAIRADTGGHYVSQVLPRRVLAEPLPLGNSILLVDQRGITTLYEKKK